MDERSKISVLRILRQYHNHPNKCVKELGDLLELVCNEIHQIQRLRPPTLARISQTKFQLTTYDKDGAPTKTEMKVKSRKFDAEASIAIGVAFPNILPINCTIGFCMTFRAISILLTGSESYGMELYLCTFGHILQNIDLYGAKLLGVLWNKILDDEERNTNGEDMQNLACDALLVTLSDMLKRTIVLIDASGKPHLKVTKFVSVQGLNRQEIVLVKMKDRLVPAITTTHIDQLVPVSFRYVAGVESAFTPYVTKTQDYIQLVSFEYLETDMAVRVKNQDKYTELHVETNLEQEINASERCVCFDPENHKLDGASYTLISKYFGGIALPVEIECGNHSIANALSILLKGSTDLGGKIWASICILHYNEHHIVPKSQQNDIMPEELREIAAEAAAAIKKTIAVCYKDWKTNQLFRTIFLPYGNCKDLKRYYLFLCLGTFYPILCADENDYGRINVAGFNKTFDCVYKPGKSKGKGKQKQKSSDILIPWEPEEFVKERRDRKLERKKLNKEITPHSRKMAAAKIPPLRSQIPFLSYPDEKEPWLLKPDATKANQEYLEHEFYETEKMDRPDMFFQNDNNGLASSRDHIEDPSGVGDNMSESSGGLIIDEDYVRPSDNDNGPGPSTITSGFDVTRRSLPQRKIILNTELNDENTHILLPRESAVQWVYTMSTARLSHEGFIRLLPSNIAEEDVQHELSNFFYATIQQDETTKIALESILHDGFNITKLTETDDVDDLDSIQGNMTRAYQTSTEYEILLDQLEEMFSEFGPNRMPNISLKEKQPNNIFSTECAQLNIKNKNGEDFDDVMVHYMFKGSVLPGSRVKNLANRMIVNYGNDPAIMLLVPPSESQKLNDLISRGIRGSDFETDCSICSEMSFLLTRAQLDKNRIRYKLVEIRPGNIVVTAALSFFQIISEGDVVIKIINMILPEHTETAISLCETGLSCSNCTERIKDDTSQWLDGNHAPDTKSQEEDSSETDKTHMHPTEKNFDELNTADDPYDPMEVSGYTDSDDDEDQHIQYTDSDEDVVKRRHRRIICGRVYDDGTPCDRGFLRRDRFTTHLSVDHNLDYVCRACNYATSDKLLLNEHYEKEHKMGAKLCKYCFKGFVTMKERSEHEKICPLGSRQREYAERNISKTKK